MCFKSPKIETRQPVQLTPPPPAVKVEEERQLDPKIGVDRETNRRRRGVNALRTDLSLNSGPSRSGLNL